MCCFHCHRFLTKSYLPWGYVQVRQRKLTFSRVVVITRTTTTGQNDTYTHACTDRERERGTHRKRQTDRDKETERDTDRQNPRVHKILASKPRVKNVIVRSSFDLMSRTGTLVSINHDALGSTRNTLRSIFGSTTAWRYIIASGVTDGLTHTNSVYVLCTILRRAVHWPRVSNDSAHCIDKSLVF